MKLLHLALRGSLVLGALAMAGAAHATTVTRLGVDRLAAASEVIVHAKVLDIHSYWNAAHDFILTDVRLRPSEFLKGAATGDVTLTVMGGSVGEVTTLVIGGADLVPGSDYVLFLAHGDLPGAANRLTVRDHAQDVFEVDNGHASSEAIDEPLLPDAEGRTDVAGGTSGLALADLIRRIRAGSDH